MTTDPEVPPEHATMPSSSSSSSPRDSLPELSTLAIADPAAAAGEGEESVDAKEEQEQTSVPANAKPDGPKVSDPFQFGSRLLLPTDDPFSFNAWDHVEIDDEYAAFTQEQLSAQRAKPVSAHDKARFNGNPAKWWDIFYKNNGENFFKDRKWLQQEFPILSAATGEEYGPCVVVELGCGAGNTLFPVLQINTNPRFCIHGCDFAPNAVAVVKAQELYAQYEPKGNVRASVYDLSAEDTLPEGVEAGSVDIVIMVFVFSALAPSQWIAALRNVRRMLKPGGKVLFRDYGRHDLAQVRFKGGRYLDENFYIRGDGTRVYFFEEEQLGEIFSGVFREGSDLPAQDAEDGYGGFKVESLATDKRMLVNRTRKIKMYRRWMQAVFEKL
ncbi:putative actin-binding protein ABP140 [Tricharina praecox]|uniref:putative actin-binding protein ABP140 n=1 Tax=Tricharina praecox TaxID=43433 RepID=UPI0022203E40|nr:putative actin-binding protein ABP140 [Tricharina praecox]KAI5849979.1 putative actin-binding protein ABP140 [Tricharina praecox]